MYGGLVEGCQIVTNVSVGKTGASGAGVWMTGPSLLLNSVIAENTISAKAMSTAGAGVCCRDANNRSVVRNCLILNNTLGSSNNADYPGRGGGVHLDGGRLENCTVTGNRIELNNPGAVYGGGLVCLKGSVVNTIFWNNVIAVASEPELVDNVWADSIPSCFNSCAPELTTGVQGNVADDPLFVNFEAGNFRLEQGSPCINKGANQDWMVGALDLDNLRRVNSGLVDMGAYEFIPPLGTILLFR